MKLLGPGGGEVQHAPSKIPVAGQVIISMAPVAGCAAELVLVGWLLKAPLFQAIKPAPMSAALTPAGIGEFVTGALESMWGLARGIRDSDWGSWKTYVFIYAAVCLGIAIRPSFRDFRNSAFGLVFLGGLIAIIDWIFRASRESTAVTDYVLKPIQKPLHYLVAFMGLVVMLTVIVWILQLLIHMATSPRGGKPHAADAKATKE